MVAPKGREEQNPSQFRHTTPAKNRRGRAQVKPNALAGRDAFGSSVTRLRCGQIART